MKFTLATSACLIASAFAGSLPVLVSRDSPFTDATCKLSQALTPGTPLITVFPAASHLGNIVGPLLKTAIGTERLEKIDALADQLCVNSQQEPAGERGICAETLQAVKDVANALLPITQAAKYKCLLNLLCVAQAGTTDGTCQYLLAGADCVANRIIQAKDLECQ